MDLSELPQGDARVPADPSAVPQPSEAEVWRRLLTQVGEEIAGPLTLALERVLALTTTGQIDSQSLRQLREELEHARRAGMVGQQIARFRSGRVRQSAEKVHLTQTLQQVLAHRRRETEARGIEVRQVMRPVEVIVDPALLFSLLNAVLDWALRHARSNIALRLDVKSWPMHARLSCRFRLTPLDQVDAAGFAQTAPPDGLDLPVDDLHWRLIEHTAAVMGLVLERESEGPSTALVLEFPRTVSPDLQGLTVTEVDDGFAHSSANSKPLAGSHVLVVASRRDVRIQVREAIRHMGLVVDFVTSIDEASAFCQDSLPHAIVFESVLRGERFNQLREDVLREVPDFVFVEIIEEGAMFEVSGFGGGAMARVGRDAILTSLPSALLFELSRTI